MPASKTKSSKAQVKVKDLKAKKNPKGGQKKNIKVAPWA